MYKVIFCLRGEKPVMNQSPSRPLSYFIVSIAKADDTWSPHFWFLFGDLLHSFKIMKLSFRFSSSSIVFKKPSTLASFSLVFNSAILPPIKLSHQYF